MWLTPGRASWIQQSTSTLAVMENGQQPQVLNLLTIQVLLSIVLLC